MSYHDAYPDAVVSGSGTATAPAANAILAQLTTLTPGGIYEVKMFLALTGTAETNLRNVRLRQNGVAAIDLIPTLSGTNWLQIVSEVLVTGGNLDVQVIAAATAGSVYTTLLLASRIS